MQPTFNFSGESFVFPDSGLPDPQQQPPAPLYNEFLPPQLPPQDYQPQPQPFVQNQPYGYSNYIDPLLPNASLPHQPIQPAFPVPLPPAPRDLTVSPSTSLRIRLPAMPPTTRGASRHQPSSPTASGSEYHESNASMDVGEEEHAAEKEESPEPVEYGVSSRGRRVQKKSYKESDDDPLDVISSELSPKGQHKVADPEPDEDDDDEPIRGRYALRTRTRGHPNKLNGFIVSDEEDGGAKVGRYPTRNRNKSASNGQSNGNRITRRSNGRFQPQASSSRPTRNGASTRRTRSSARNAEDEDDGYIDEPSSGSADGEGSLDEAPVTSPEPEIDMDADADADAEGDADPEPEQDGKPYSLRQRAKINYAIPPPLEEMRPPPKPRSGGARAHGRSNRPKPPGWSASGAELSRWMGAPADDSVCAMVAYRLYMVH